MPITVHGSCTARDTQHSGPWRAMAGWRADQASSPAARWQQFSGMGERGDERQRSSGHPRYNTDAEGRAELARSTLHRMLRRHTTPHHTTAYHTTHAPLHARSKNQQAPTNLQDSADAHVRAILGQDLQGGGRARGGGGRRAGPG